MTNLVTIEEYKESEGITSPKDDLRLNNLIPSVSQLVKTYCGNSIIDHYSSAKTETLNINWDTNIIQLTESPVNTITSVEERDSYSSAYNTLTTSDYEYYFDESTDTIIRTNGSAYRNWRKGPGAVRVTYTAGYESCPEDLKLAVIDLITYYLKDEHKERRTLAGATVQNQVSTTQTNNVAFPDHIKRVLDLYKNF
jgi:hypothetical protein